MSVALRGALGLAADHVRNAPALEVIDSLIVERATVILQPDSSNVAIDGSSLHLLGLPMAA